jgi:hypothetical protein
MLLQDKRGSIPPNMTEAPRRPDGCSGFDVPSKQLIRIGIDLPPDVIAGRSGLPRKSKSSQQTSRIYLRPMQLHMDRAKRCGARTPSGKPCQSPVMQTVSTECTVAPYREHQRAIGMLLKHGRCRQR